MKERGDERKHDYDKPMWDLVPLKQVEKIAEVMTYEAKKYGELSWTEIDNPDRYFAAAMRHLADHQNRDLYDPESGLSHLAHAACNLIFFMWFQDCRG